jgi:acetoin:2,6-dichlorophenolindophenol oxidoreductase subunit alpha
VTRARNGEGPTLLEIHTVRLWGHFEGDAQAYRGDELAVAEAHDPIPAYEAKLRADGLLDDTSAAAIRAEAQAEVDAAIAFALASPEPDPSTLSDYVFA